MKRTLRSRLFNGVCVAGRSRVIGVHGRLIYPNCGPGIDMASEHERYLCEQVYHKPVIVYNYPCAIKSFYMRRNPAGTDGAPEPTCAAMDVLVPGVGELIGGSVRLSPKPTKPS
eukprot:COSAG01_NODE_6270_length_3761_cov_20.095576_3_plen_114_part_00